ncbi:hypothetical protein [Streptomyces sp. NPDC002644]
MPQQKWTIKAIEQALVHPEIVKDFRAQIDNATADELLNVFSKWEKKAERSRALTARGREITEAEDRGEELPGEWIDITSKVTEEAQRIVATVAERLPHPALQETFLNDIRQAPEGQFSSVIDRWTNFTTSWESGSGKTEAIRDYFKEHGELPPGCLGEVEGPKPAS